MPRPVRCTATDSCIQEVKEEGEEMSFLGAHFPGLARDICASGIRVIAVVRALKNFRQLG